MPDLPPGDVRKFPMGNYLIYYRALPGRIIIARVLHGKRLQRSGLSEEAYVIADVSLISMALNQPSTWNIGLSAWIVQDGNYPDFGVGETVKFAVEFYQRPETALEVLKFGCHREALKRRNVPGGREEDRRNGQDHSSRHRNFGIQSIRIAIRNRRVWCRFSNGIEPRRRPLRLLRACSRPSLFVAHYFYS